ncbi:MAG: hypothetical protein RLZZ230_393 [Candidatus Parcubacteria bacterium]|jgi:hypothetical protein
MKFRLIIALVTVLLIGVVFVLFGVITGKQENVNPARFSVTEELRVRFLNIDPTLFVSMQTRSSLWWIDEGRSYVVPATESLLVAEPTAEINYDSPVADRYYGRVLKIAREVFVQRGFVEDKINSSTTTADESFADYVLAYKKEAELCTITVNPELSSYSGGGENMSYKLEVNCGNTLTKAKQEQLPLLDALAIQDINTVAVPVKSDGYFVEVNIHGRRGGTSAVLKKEGDAYRIIIESQDIPTCELVDLEQIPNKVLSSLGGGKCWKEDSSIRDL